MHKKSFYNIKAYDTKGEHIKELDCNLITSISLAREVADERYKIPYVNATSIMEHGYGGVDKNSEEYKKLASLVDRYHVLSKEEPELDETTSTSGITYKMDREDKPRPPCEDPM